MWKNKEIHQQLKRFANFSGSSDIHLHVIHKLLVNMFKDHECKLYFFDVPLKQENLKEAVLDVGKKTFDEPYVELFLWAILCKRPNLIDFFWERTSQPILMAIVAAVIYSKLSWYYAAQNKNAGKSQQQRKRSFQDRANDLMAIAFASDAEKALSLLEKRNKRWGDRNLMQMAYIGYLRNFIASELHNLFVLCTMYGFYESCMLFAAAKIKFTARTAVIPIPTTPPALPPVVLHLSSSSLNEPMQAL
jgi:hypothetical protein